MKKFDVGEAKLTWPGGIVRCARKPFTCDYHKGEDGRCQHIILPGEYYFDSAETKSSYAGGFGTQRFCMKCAKGIEVKGGAL